MVGRQQTNLSRVTVTDIHVSFSRGCYTGMLHSKLLHCTSMSFTFADLILIFLSLGISLAIVVPLTGVLVRFRANFNPKALQLDAEGGAVPHTGPVINSYFSMMARVWRHEVRLCFQLTAYFAYCALAGCPRLLQGLQYVLQMFMTQWNLSSIHSAHPNEYILRNFINRNLHGSFQPATWQLQRA